MTYGHPYTMFDRHPSTSDKLTRPRNFNSPNITFRLDTAIQNIRSSIIAQKGKPESESPIFQAYKQIYKNAIKEKPNDNGFPNTKSVSQLSIWAKNNAFVFLVGMNDTGALLDFIDATGAKRDSFRIRAIDQAFNSLTGQIDANNPGWGWWLVPISYWVANLVEEEKYLDQLQGHSRSLIMWLQTYDLLKSAYEIRAELDLISPHRYPWGFGDADANTDGSCAPRRKLRKATRDLYYYSEGLNGITEHAFGWKKNHGIAAASAVLMGAQVLNDAGVETNWITGLFDWIMPHPKYSPINWNKFAEDGLNDNLFVGYHYWPASDVPQVNSNIPRGITGLDYSASSYAEGPGYANYGLFDCGIPPTVRSLVCWAIA